MNSTEEDTCTKFTAIYNDYIEKTIASISLLLNTLCLIAFAQIVRCTKQDIYKYLLYKSFIDILISLRFTLKSVFNCTDCQLETSYAIKVFYIIFFIYVDYALELLTMLCEVVACFNRYRFVTKTWEFFEKFSYKFVLLTITIFSFLFYVYLFFDRQINSITKSKNETIVTYFSIQQNSLGTTTIVLGYVHSVMRNVLCVAFIFIVNVLTLCSVKRVLDKKKLLVNVTSGVKNAKILSKAERAELRLTFMVLLTNLVIVVAYGMSFVKWLNIKAVDQSKCFVTINYIIYLMSFVLNFFIYYYFNLSFKKFLKFSTKSRKEATNALRIYSVCR